MLQGKAAKMSGVYSGYDYCHDEQPVNLFLGDKELIAEVEDKIRLEYPPTLEAVEEDRPPIFKIGKGFIAFVVSVAGAAVFLII